MRNPALFSRLFNTPLMIQPSKLDAIIAGIGGRWGLDVTPQPPEQWRQFKHERHKIVLPASGPNPDMALTDLGGERAGRDMALYGDVAVIDIIGVLAHRTGFDANSSYILGYDMIGRYLNAALGMKDVSSILLQIDSPGGEVAGAFELAAQIRRTSQSKPVKAVISSTAASAGYLLASAAQEIAISETGIAGSIGVVLRHIDISKAAEREGLNITYIYAGSHKIDGNPFEPLPTSVKADLQTQIDKIYSLFVQTVAGHRQIDTEAVRGQQAQIFTGQDAVKAGLADRIATPDEILAEMQTQKSTLTQRATTMYSPQNRNANLEQQAIGKPSASHNETDPDAEAKAGWAKATAPYRKKKIETTPHGVAHTGTGHIDTDPDAEAKAGWEKATAPYRSNKNGNNAGAR